MPTRRTWMKYQLSVEHVRMRMRLKNTTNFVRRVASFRAPVAGEVLVRVEWAIFIGSIGLVDQMVDILGKLDAQKSRRLQIHGNLQPLDRNRLGRELPVAV